jgi:hypothetical protein
MLNSLLRSIGEPAYERVEVSPAREGGLFSKGAKAKYKWVPSKQTDVNGEAINNVGGMRPNGQSNGFQSFDMVEDSIKAIGDNLKSYKLKRGIDTLTGVFSTWSPESDGNNTKKLIEDAARVTGLKPDQKIDLENPAIRAVITAAIIRQEGSKAYRSGIKDSTGGAVQIAKPEQQKSIDPVKKGVSIWNDQNHPLAAGSVDAGEMMGKPIAAAGEMMSDTVTMAIDLIQKATKQRVTDADIAQIKAYAKEVNDPEKVANAYLNLGGAPAKNTEQYMQRTSSKNLNQ